MPDFTLQWPAWLQNNPALQDIWLAAWEETGDELQALEAVRQSELYDQIFAGNRRDDGSLRYDENTYLGIIESYEDILLSFNLNPDIFRAQFPAMIAGLKSPAEFESNVTSVYERIIMQAPEVAQWAAQTYGLELSTEGLLAMALDPVNLAPEILSRKISMAEVGGAAAAKSFTVGADLAEKMVQYGLDTTGEAQDYFAQAEALIPTLEVLTARHADPEDDFDLTDFTNATLFGDAEQRRRMRRLLAQERVSFGSDAGLTIAADNTGSLSGLVAR